MRRLLLSETVYEVKPVRTHLLPASSLTVKPADVEMVWRALEDYADRLSWERLRAYSEEAKANIREEESEYRRLALSIYESHIRPLAEPRSPQ